MKIVIVGAGKIGYSLAEELETLSSLLDRLFDNLAGDEFRDLTPHTAFLYDQQKEKMEETDD